MRAVGILLAAFAVLWSGGNASAQDAGETGSEDLIAACVSAFESALHVEYFTAEDLAVVQSGALANEQMVNLVFVRYPDANGSCLTENGVLLPEYVGAVMVCSPNAYGVLVPHAVITLYLTDPYSKILADPMTGACPSSPDEPWYVPLAWFCQLNGFHPPDAPAYWRFHGYYGTEVGVAMREAEGAPIYRRTPEEACVVGEFATEAEAWSAA